MPRYQQLGPIIFAQLTTAERDAEWVSPPDNLVIHNVTENVIQIYDGSNEQWVNVAMKIVPSIEDWSGVSGSTEDRIADMDATTVDELADIVGTLISDLRAIGLLA